MNLFQRAWTAALAARPERAGLDRAAATDLAVAELRRSARSYAGVALVLVDGRSGSGKSVFAMDLLDACPEAQVLHLDDLYPDWDGLAAGIERAQQLVHAWSTGGLAVYTPTTWPGTPPRDPVRLDSDRSLVVEGVGARRCLPHAAREIAPLTLYLDAPETVRRTRALDRDGETYAPYWAGWAAQEENDLDRHPIPAEPTDLYVVHDPDPRGGPRA